MANNEKKQSESSSKLLNWIDERFPYTETMRYHITEYYASKNFNFWYVFGVLAMVYFGHPAIHRNFLDDEL